jgi:hypothetical protein
MVAFQVRETLCARLKMSRSGMKEMIFSRSSGTSKTLIEAVVGEVESILRTEIEESRGQLAPVFWPRSMAWQWCQ